MSLSSVSILNLLYRYAECIDAGDFQSAADLFRHARVLTAFGELDDERLLALWRDLVIVYDDGTPRTKHVITNPILEIDEDNGTATCRSYYTVLQCTDGRLQPIAAGRYHDRFERADNVWRFSYRDYSLLDLVGDTSGHLTQSIPR